MTQLDQACSRFRELLQEQMDRASQMDPRKVDLSQKETVVIGLIDGDGIGPVIMAQAKRVLRYSEGTDTMKKIASSIRAGANAYLKGLPSRTDWKRERRCRRRSWSRSKPAMCC